MKGYQVEIKVYNASTGKVLFDKILPESCDISFIDYSKIIEILSFLWHPTRLNIVFEYSEYDEIKSHG